VFERRFDHVTLEILGWMVMLARRKAAVPAASVCAFVARRRRCPGLMVVETYVAMGVIPPVTEVAQVMCLGDGVVVGATGRAGGLKAVGRVMVPSLVMTPSLEVVQPLTRLPEAAPWGQALFLFGPNARGKELPLELPL
jgi:hypothetical protein